MKIRFKKPATVFLVLNTIFLVVWATLAVVIGLNSGLDFADFFKVYAWEGHIKPAGRLLLRPNFELWQTYVMYAIAGIAVIMLIVGIILSITRKRKRFIFYILSFLVSIGAAFDIIAQFDGYWAIITGKVEFPEVYKLILYIVFIVGGVLAYLTHFFVYFFGLAYAKRRLAQPAVEPQEEQPEEVEEVEAPAEDEQEDFAVAAVAEEPEAEEVIEEKQEEPLADFAVEPEEVPAQPEDVVVEEVPQPEVDPEKAPVNKEDLASILKDVVRDIVRDEIARANAEKEEAKKEEKPQQFNPYGLPGITGATFGGPLVVQYFNGGINSPTPAPAPAPAPAPEPKPEPQPEPEPEPAPAPASEIVAEEPVPAPAPVEGPVVEEKSKNQIVRIPFTQRLLESEEDLQNIYNELKNELLSWGLHSRVSNSGDAFRLHTKTYVKITVAGKNLKLYFALDPADYADSTLPIQDASEKGLYVDIPLVFKVKSGLSVRRAKQLIKDACEKDGLYQEEVGTVNWIKELKAEQKAKK